MKRFLALILSVLMIFTLIPSMAYAGEAPDIDVTYNGLWYAVDPYGTEIPSTGTPYVEADFYLRDDDFQYSGFEVYMSDREAGEYTQVYGFDRYYSAETASFLFEPYYDGYYDEWSEEWIEYDYPSYSDAVAYINLPEAELGKTRYFKFLPYVDTEDGRAYGDFTAPMKQKLNLVPSIYSAECVSTSKIKLSMGCTGTVDGYYVYRYNSSSGSYKKIKTLYTKDSSYLEYTDTKLKNKTTYKYKIAAFVKLEDGTKYVSPKSEVIKAKTTSNVYAQNADTTNQYMEDHYGEVAFQNTKAYYSDGKLVMRYCIMNCASGKLKKLDWIRISVYDYEGGTLIAQQKFSNVSLGLTQYDYKFRNFTFSKERTKKKSKNLRNGVYWEIQYGSNWG